MYTPTTFSYYMLKTKKVVKKPVWHCYKCLTGIKTRLKRFLPALKPVFFKYLVISTKNKNVIFERPK